jgi:hypothetical protein
LSEPDRVIYVAATVGQAHALKNLLEANGIEAYVINDTLGSGEIPGGFFDTAPRVVVHEEDAEDARRIALAAEYAVHEGSTAAELDELERAADDAAEWPTCPSCRRRRLTSCPVCETAGTHFDEAFLPDATPEDDQPAGGGRANPLLVICPTCDEPFRPRFPARCEWCGYRFGESQEPSATGQRPVPPAEPQINRRVVIVIVGMLASMGALLGWFYYILHDTR